MASFKNVLLIGVRIITSRTVPVPPTLWLHPTNVLLTNICAGRRKPGRACSSGIPERSFVQSQRSSSQGVYFSLPGRRTRLQSRLYQMATGTFTGVYSYSLFLPTIIRDLGYSNATAQLMSTPPYIVACAICIGAGWWADKVQQRGIFMIAFTAMA
ncbi:hypothetical protein B0J13DRAFT_199927 [Dactylonectria estremocensis]|uniref:Major facilitator superfamily (MFS) profile domain-containing protein n=1 Tax=Dactylonectria estremocensis TaxID=1079267 RepID=A0A9P9DD41_9HYPO|nr:hypothetical protein B0J13DRAFT_199927 [Dactylonectria estremocensis]